MTLVERINSLKPDSMVRMSALQLLLMIIAIIGFSFAYLNMHWDLKSDIKTLQHRVGSLEGKCK